MRFPTRAGTENNLKILKENHEYVLPTGWSLADAGMILIIKLKTEPFLTAVT